MELPDESLYMYTPDDRFDASNVAMCDPADFTPLTSVATRCPVTLNTSSVTAPLSGRVYEMFVVGLNGFG
jgi:hypothetical protein